MTPKLKTWMKPSKKGLATKLRKRAQLLPDRLSSEDKSEATLRDVMIFLGTLTTHVTATEKKLATSLRLTHEAPPLVEQAPPLVEQAPPLVQQAPPLVQQAPPLVQQATRLVLHPQSEEIQPRDTHTSPDFGGLLDIEEQVRARLAESCRGT